MYFLLNKSHWKVDYKDDVHFDLTQQRVSWWMDSQFFF